MSEDHPPCSPPGPAPVGPTVVQVGGDAGTVVGRDAHAGAGAPNHGVVVVAHGPVHLTVQIGGRRPRTTAGTVGPTGQLDLGL